jgi:transcriptional regulator with XRE-family HTH domain
MNQIETADVLGCSVATVSRICSGERRPSVDLMMEIRRVFSWSIDAQVSAIESGRYADEFTGRMEQRRLRQRMRRGRTRA